MSMKREDEERPERRMGEPGGDHVEESRLELAVLSPASLAREESDGISLHLGECAACREDAERFRETYERLAGELSGVPTEEDRRRALRLTIPRPLLTTASPVKHAHGDALDAYAEIVDPSGSWPVRRIKQFVLRRPLRFAGGVSLAAAAVVAGFLLARPPEADQRPAYAEIRTHLLTVYNNQAVPLWTRPVLGSRDQTSRDLLADGSRHLVRVLDIDGDGIAEVLLTGSGPRDDLAEDTLYCYSASGLLLWQAGGGEKQVFGRAAYTLDGVWSVQTSFTVPDPATGKPRLFALFNQLPHFPAKLAELDPGDGRILAEFLHPGHFTSLHLRDADDDGRTEILLGGINNPHGRAAVALLDPSEIAGLAPMPDSLRPSGFGTAGPGDAGSGAAAGLEGYFLLPRTDLSWAASKGPYNSVSAIDDWKRDGFLVVTKEEVGGELSHYGGMIYSFGPGPRLLDVSANDSYRIRHQRLTAEGRTLAEPGPAFYAALRDSVLSWDGRAFVRTTQDPAGGVDEGR